MDDDEGKARRNLLIASSLVVLGVWLEVPLPELADKVLGVKGGSSISDWRAWVAVLVVLGYLAHRYGFSEEASGLLKRWKQARWSRQAKGIRGLLVSDLRRSDQLDCNSRHFLRPLVEYRAALAQRTGLDTTKGERVRLEMGDFTMPHPEEWRGFARLDAKVEGRDTGFQGEEVKFKVTTVGKALVSVKAFVLFTVASRETTQSIAPLAAGVLAGGAALWKLVASLLP